MSKIGGWILENQETRNWIKTVNPYDRHSNKDTYNNGIRNYYDMSRRNKRKKQSSVLV